MLRSIAMINSTSIVRRDLLVTKAFNAHRSESKQRPPPRFELIEEIPISLVK